MSSLKITVNPTPEWNDKMINVNLSQAKYLLSPAIYLYLIIKEILQWL